MGLSSDGSIGEQSRQAIQEDREECDGPPEHLLYRHSTGTAPTPFIITTLPSRFRRRSFCSLIRVHQS